MLVVRIETEKRNGKSRDGLCADVSYLDVDAGFVRDDRDAVDLCRANVRRAARMLEELKCAAASELSVIEASSSSVTRTRVSAIETSLLEVV
jgi:hypothetical protein